MLGSLYIVSTPIGNLSDISNRAIDVLNDVDLIAAEDTRITKKILSFYKIKNQVITYNNFNEINKSKKILELLLEGNKIALVSDSGTPCISDPGYRIVNLALLNDIKVLSIPGPSSAISALSISGLPTDKFYFEGLQAVSARMKLPKDFSHYLDTLYTNTEYSQEILDQGNWRWSTISSSDWTAWINASAQTVYKNQTYSLTWS